MRAFITLLSAICAVLIGTSLYAQQKKDSGAIPPEISNAMQVLVGEWEFAIERDGKTIKETWVTRWADGKHCQVARVNEEGVQATSIMGYDRSTGQITELAFYSSGDYFLFRYKVDASGVWQGDGIGVDQGKPFTEKLELKKLGPGKLQWKAYDFVLGGEKQPDLIAIATRAKKQQVKIDIPQKALDALQFFVGDWEGETDQNGEKIGMGRDKRRWTPGKHCIQMTSSGVESGNARVGYGVCGWDAHDDQLVEQWFVSDGLSVIVRYPLAKMTDDVFSGSFTVTFPDGTVCDGTCELKKNNAGFTWIARWEQDGKEIVRTSEARRVSS